MRRLSVLRPLVLLSVILGPRAVAAADLRPIERGPYRLVVPEAREEAEQRTILVESGELTVSSPTASELASILPVLSRLGGDGGGASVENGVVLQTSFLDSQCPPPQLCEGNPCNEVLFLWNEPELNEGDLTISVNGADLGTLPALPPTGVPGTNAVFISGFPPGEFTFRADAPDGTHAEATMTVIDSLPFSEPENITCTEDPDGPSSCNLAVAFENEGPFPDVYLILFDGDSIGELPGDQTGLTVTESPTGEHCVTLLGFLENEGGTYRGCFHEVCCELTCEDLPCDAPRSLLLCQADYGEGEEDNSIRGAWVVGEDDYEAITAFVDGNSVGDLPGDSGGAVFGLLAPGEHTVGVQGDCGDDGDSTITEDSITLLTETPHPTPIAEDLSCSFSAAGGGTTTVTWTNAEPSIFIDVFVFDGMTLFFVGSLAGSAEDVEINGTTGEETIVLQFFADIDGTCYGSPLFACTPPTARYLPGACNGAGEINLSDAICNLNFLFLGGSAPSGWIDGQPTCVAVVEGDDCTDANAVCETLP